MTRRQSRQFSLALIAAASTAWLPGAADGTTKTWMPTGGGSYYADANWSPTVEPGAGDVALFDLSFAYTVTFPIGTFNPNPNNLRIEVGDDSPTFSLGGHTYTVTAPGTSTDPSILLGSTGRAGTAQGSLTILSGHLVGVNAVAGNDTGFGLGHGSTGALIVSTGASLNLSSGFFAGFDGNTSSGRLNIINGGDATVQTAWIGYGSGGGRGSLTTSGSGSSLSAQFLNVGVSGNGTMLVDAGASATNSAEAYIGRFAGSTGRVTVDGVGSSWTNNGSIMFVGGSGAGSLTIQNGGVVNSPDPSIGDGTGSIGNAVVTGAGSRWTAIGSSGSIGKFGTGSLTVSAGGTASIGGGISVGRQNGSNGNLTITGNGSKYLGFNLLVGDSGNGSLAITSGGLGTFNGNTNIGSQPNGRGFAIVDGAGSRLETDAVLFVGDAGRGTLNISNGGVATTSFAQIGSSINSIGAGTANVSGPGSSLISNSSLNIGAGIGLSGLLNINNSGSVSVGGELLLGPHGTITMNAGNLNAGSLTHYGAFDQTGGVSTIGPVDGTSTISLSGAGSFTADHVRIDTLVVGGNSVAKIRANGTNTGTSVVKNLAILGTANAWQGKVDLSDNDLVVDYSLSSPIASVRDQIRTGRNDGAWNGNGLTSSAAQGQSQHATTLGTIEGTDYHAALGAAAAFSGQNVDNTSVLVKYTWYGDSDLNGVVNFDDYSRIDAGFSSGGADWFHGDFNYDEHVNFDDYALIDLAFNAQSGALHSAMAYLGGSDPSGGMNEPSLRLVQQHFEQFGQAYASSFLNAVPEPTGMAVACAFSVLTCRRRRRHR